MFQNNTLDTLTKKSDLIPISVEDCPSILAKGNTLRISSDELKSVQSFITLNKEIFLKYMNDTHFGMHDFFAAMKLCSLFSSIHKFTGSFVSTFRSIVSSIDENIITLL